MSMCDRNVGSKSGFCLRRFSLILLLIMLLPVYSVAENLTCNRLPMLMQGLLAEHYVTKNMTGEINTHAVDQMIKRIDPSRTLLYESDLERLKPALQGAFASMHAGNCAAAASIASFTFS